MSQCLVSYAVHILGVGASLSREDKPQRKHLHPVVKETHVCEK